MEFSQIKELEKIGVSNLSAYIRKLIKKDLENLERFIKQLKEKGFSDSDIEKVIERVVN
jgi:microsomal dipeptidase-like Zn-dependent dipeptidase